MSNGKDFVVYMAQCTLKGKESHRYIGKANNLDERIRTHKQNGLKARPGRFDDLYIRLGTDHWDFEILEFCENEEEAYDKEAILIRKLKATGIDLLNATHNVVKKSSKANKTKKALKISLSRRSDRNRKLRIESGELKPVINLTTSIEYDSITEAGENEKFHRVSISKWAKTGEKSPPPQNYQYAFMDSDGVPIMTEGHNQIHYRIKRVKCRDTGEIFDSTTKCSEIMDVTEKGVRGVCNGSYMSTGDRNLSFCYLDEKGNEILHDNHNKYDEKKLMKSKLRYGMFHTSKKFENIDSDDIYYFQNKDEIINKLKLLKQSDYVHIDDVCKGERKNVKEFRFFHIIDDKEIITDSHKEEPDKVIYRVRCIDDGKIFNNASDAAKRYGLNSSQVSKVCKGKISQTGGYEFENIDWLDRNLPKNRKTKKTKKYLIFPSGKSVNSIDKISQETGLAKNRIRKYLKGEKVNIGNYKITQL